MEYPKWVNEPKNQTAEEKRTKRLQFLVRRAGLHLVDGTGSIAPIANAAGLSVNTVCVYMKRGRFPKASALAFERVFGRDLCPYELLMDPLGKIEPVKILN